MWCPLLERQRTTTASGGFLVMSTCHSSKAALSPCRVALFVNPVARVPTSRFFTLYDLHLEQERDSQATCLSSWPMPTGARLCALWQRRVFRATLQESCGSHCRRVHFVARLTKPYHATPYQTIPYSRAFERNSFAICFKRFKSRCSLFIDAISDSTVWLFH